MSHEIRTPLNGIIGNAQLLKMTSQTLEQIEFTEQIQNSSTHLLTVINDILSFSRLDAGGVELENLPFELASCIEQAIHLAFKKGQDDRLEVFFFIDSKIPTYINGDSTRVRQILVNLTANALKFSADHGQVVIYARLIAAAGNSPTDASTAVDAKSPSLKVKSPSTRFHRPKKSFSLIQSGPYFHEYASRLLQPGEYLIEFEVRDTGVGIAADKQDKLFKAFSQVDSSIQRQYGTKT